MWGMELNFDKLKDIVGFNTYYSEEERYRTSWAQPKGEAASRKSHGSRRRWKTNGWDLQHVE